MLASRLPASFRGYRVAFPVTREPGGPARHRVEVADLGPWLTGRLGFDPRRGITRLDWLATPTQRLAEVTAGEVFHDGPGCPAGLGTSLAAAISAGDWPTREQHMCHAYQAVAALHNELGFTAPLDTRVQRFYERPYQVIGADRFTAALREAIADRQLRQLPLTGAIDQFTDSTDALGRLPFLRACARAAIGEPGTARHAAVPVRRDALGDAPPTPSLGGP